MIFILILWMDELKAEEGGGRGGGGKGKGKGT